MVADGQQAAERNQQYQRYPCAPGGGGHQLRCADIALLIARHVSPGVGPTDAGAGGHDANPDNHCAHGRRFGTEHALPVDRGAQKTADQQIERAKNVSGPFLNDQQRRVPQAGNRKGQQGENTDKHQGEHWRVLGFGRGVEQD